MSVSHKQNKKMFSASYKKQREQRVVAILMNADVMIWVSSMGSLVVSTSVPNCHAFVCFCVGIVLKMSFKEDGDMTLQVFAGSF